MHRWAFVAAVVALSSWAGELRPLQEFRYEDTSRTFRRLDTDRFIEIGREWEPGDQKARLAVLHWRVLDVAERRVVRVSIPMTTVRAQNPQVLNERAVGTLVHHDGAVSTVTFKQVAPKGYQSIATWVGQYDHRAQRFSGLVKLGDHDAGCLTDVLGFDVPERFLYVSDFIDPAGDVMKNKPSVLRMRRISLRTLAWDDWSFTLEQPARARRLELNRWFFDPTGRRIAFVEYDDRAGQHQGPVSPPAQVSVLDVETKTVDTYPLPLSVYAVAFTPDGKQLVLGSYEEGALLRIDLDAKRVAATAKGFRHLDAFAMSPSGKTFLLFFNTELLAQKVVEVRRVDTLAVVAAIPVRLLTPGTDLGPRSVITLSNGRQLLFPSPEQKSAPTARGVFLYEVPDEVDSGAVAGASAKDVTTAKGIVAARAQAGGLGLQMNEDPRTGDPKETFGAVAVHAAGSACAVGIRSGNSDGDYRPGRTTPVVFLVDAKGKLAWKREVGAKGFKDYEAGGVAATADGGCVVHVLSYVSPGAYPVARFVKLDAKGRPQWDYRFRGAGQLDTPLADVTRLLPDGHVRASGRIYPAKDVKKAWSAELDEKGRVVFDRVED